MCRRHESECGPISWRGKCSECGFGLCAANLIGMKTMSGPFALHWRRRMAASVGAGLLDDVRSNP